MALDFSKAAAATNAKKRMQSATAMLDSTLVFQIEPAKIRESPLNSGIPCEDLEELAESLKRDGQIEPLGVYELGNDHYEVYSGHRRLRAAKLAGLKTVACIKKKYPEDPQVRFQEHSAANAQRVKDCRYWIAEVRNAKTLLAAQGFSGSREEEVAKISELLGSGASAAQIYRFEGIAKLRPDLLVYEKYGVSPAVLYSVVKFTDRQQYELSEACKALAEDGKLSRETFLQAAAKLNKKEKKHVSRSYREHLAEAESGFLKRLGSVHADNEEERDAALEIVNDLRAKLDEIENKLTNA